MQNLKIYSEYLFKITVKTTIVLFLFAFSISPSLAATVTKKSKSQSQAKYHYPYLVLDAYNNPDYPKNFRSSKTPYPRHTKHAPSRVGLDDLNISGSAQFTKNNLENMMRDLKVHSGYIIDLRQESHGFLNNSPISWYGLNNAENRKRTPDQIETVEYRLIHKLAPLKHTTVYDRIRKKNGEVVFKPRLFYYQTASTEKELIDSIGFKYIRIYVLDKHPPTNQQVDQFVEFVKGLPKTNTPWLHFHCRAGKGRTTTFMILYDIIRNAHKVSFETIIKRQTLIGGKDFMNVAAMRPAQIPMNQIRMKLLEKFYQYAKDPKGYPMTSWSHWLKRNTL